MADKVGESLLTALEDRPVSISVEAKKKGKPSSGKPSASTSHFSRMEHVLLAGTSPGTKDEPVEEPDRKKEAVQRFAALGLGRGVDATRSKPWVEKTSFQVRSLECCGDYDKLMGIEQGGAVEAYEYEAWSERKLQLKLQHSVAMSSIAATDVPVTIGMDADHSRTSTNSRHVVGRRVHNRTISFREEFDEMPNATSKETEACSHGKKELTFEDKLAKWVLEQLHRDGESDDEASPAVEFHKWFKPSEHADRKDDIKKHCYDFVSFFHVTHYVSALELGALEYSVMTEEDYLRKVGAAGSFGLEKVVSATLKSKSSYSLHKKRENSQLKRVGLIKNPEGGEYYVPRGTYAEAVIGVEMKPIHLLIRHETLRRLLKEAVNRYIQTWVDQQSSEGPYLIAADTVNRETVYLSVNEDDMSLQAAAEKEKASEFLVLMTEQGTKANEFHIVYIGKSKTAKQGYRQPIMAPPDRSQDEDTHEPSSDCEGKQYKPPYRYLSTPLSIVGTNWGPPHFELNPKKQHTMFVLHSRLRTRGAPAEVLGPWVQGHEGYFINCHARKFKRDGYLAVRRVIKDGSERYCPVCVPSRRSTEDYFKVFSLVRPPMEEQSATVREPSLTVPELKSSPYPSRAQIPSKTNKTDAKDGTEMQSLMEAEDRM